MLKGNYSKKFDKFPWQKNFKYLSLWKKGLTGYPIVDAGMRELYSTGWMHNRVRMIVGSFLVKHLLIPCAHAPGLAPLPIDYDLDPRTSGEEIGYTFLQSVLVGLSRAPDLIYKSEMKAKEKRHLF